MKYDLVFEGGGAKGIVFVGALKAFEEQQHQFGRLVGTSAGAITVALLAAGYDSAELTQVLLEKDAEGNSVFEAFMGEPGPYTEEEVANSAIARFFNDLNLPYVPDFVEERLESWLLNKFTSRKTYRNLFSFIEYGGWYSADAFIDWMTEKLNTGSYNGQPRNFGNMTLAEYYEATGHHISLVCADTTNGRLLILNKATAPDCPVVWGVRMSMSIPLLWQEVIWQPEWGSYLNRDISGNRIVDGGLLSNFPIELLISEEPYILELMGSREADGVLGMLIDENLTVDGLTQAKENRSKKGIDFGSLQVIQRLERLVNTATQAHDKMVIDAFERFVLRLPAKDVPTTEFAMPDNKREKLIRSGLNYAERYFTTIKDGVVAMGLPENDPRLGDSPALGLAEDDLHKANRVAMSLFN